MLPASGRRPGPRHRRVALRFLAAGVVAAALGAAGAAASAATEPAAHRGEAAASPSARGSTTRTFGVRPAGPRALDARISWDYNAVKPGATLVDRVGVMNMSSSPVQLTVYAADAYNTPDGGYDVYPADRKSTTVGAWVTLARRSVTVAARSTLIIPFQVKVPRDAEPGDHAGGIVASLRSHARDSRGTRVALDERAGARMTFRVVGPLQPKLVVTNLRARFHSRNPVIGRGSVDVDYTVANQGNVRLAAHQSVRVADYLGGSDQASGLGELTEILPGNSVRRTARIDSTLARGLMRAQVVLDPSSVAGHVDPALNQVRAEKLFFATSWVLSLLFALLLALGCWLGRRWYLRRRRRSRGTDDPGLGPTAEAPAAARTVSVRSRRSARQRALVRRRVTALTPGILGAATVVAGLLWQVPSAAPAGAADSQVTFIPSRGQDISPMYLFTPAGCPRPATNVIATAYGAGFGDEGVVVVPNGHAGVRSDGGFGVPLQDTLNGFAAAQHTTLHGSYRIVVRCIDTLDRHTFATYTGTVSFADPHRYTARPPSRVPTDGNVPLGVLAEQFPELTAAAAAASGSGPSPGVAGAAGTTGDQAAEAGTTTAGRAAAGGAAATASGSSTPAAVAVLLGGGVLGCTVALGVRHRRRSGP